VAQPVIGQKVNDSFVRMRDGEYSLLGGLSMNSDSLSVSGLPGVSNIPLLGYLFGTKQRDREKDDILIALVPHIIRAQSVADQNSDGVLAGTERLVKVERKSEPQPAALPSPVTPAQTNPPVTSPSPLGRPIPSAPVPTQPVPAQPNPNQPNPNPPNPSPPGAPQVPPPGGQAGLLPPTNNPRMATSAADSGGEVASVQSQAATGTAVAPVPIMQQMGLAPDPPPTSLRVGTSTVDNGANRVKVRVADTTKTDANSAASAAAKSSKPEQGQALDAAPTTSANPNPK
jgi:general secretion pathway protein D